MSYRPIFIFGVARSGTNLIARMLDRHPGVAVALDPLLPLFRSWRNAAVVANATPQLRAGFDPSAPFRDYYFDANGPALLDLLLHAEANVPFDRKELGPLRDKVIERANLESPTLASRMAGLEGVTYLGLLRSAFDIIASLKPGAAWVGIKEVWVLDFLPALARAFPDARFYVIERDPHAIVASLLALAEKDPTQAAHLPSYMRHWRKGIALARRFQADPALRDRLSVVSYEKLVAEPENEMKLICHQLRLKFITAILQLSADGWKGNSSYDHSGRDVYAVSVDRWREVLPPRIVQAVDFFCYPEMQLTPYRVFSEPRTEDVLEYLSEASARPGSWRSDSADLLVDFGGELLRHHLLTSRTFTDERLVERCFLFRDTLDSIRNHGSE